MNLSEDHGPAIVESAQQLLNLSCGTPQLSDKMDAIFLSKAISNYVNFLPKYIEVRVLSVIIFSCSVIDRMSNPIFICFRWVLY